MKTLLFLVFAVFVHSNIFAQLRLYDGKITIKPGISVKKLMKIVGKPIEKRSTKDEKENWTSFGYETTKEISFFIPSDSVFEFDPNPYGFWKAFVKNGKVQAFISSSYDTSVKVNKARFYNTVGFFDTEKQFLEKFKFKPDCIDQESDVRKEYLYLEKGIKFLIIDDEENFKVRTVLFFIPVTGNAKAEFLKIKNSSE